MKQEFIVIDDSELDCFIAEKMIRHTIRNSKTQLFTGAQKALDYITGPALKNTGTMERTIIFLDILMPVMDGFEFMEVFQKFPADVQNRYLVVGLTSSMNKKDLTKICEYKAMNRLLDKPLTSESVLALTQEVGKEDLT